MSGRVLRQAAAGEPRAIIGPAEPVDRELAARIAAAEEAAYARGHAAGYADGTRDGHEAGRGDADRLAATLATLADAAKQTAADYGHDVAALALTVARTVVDREPHDDGHALARQVATRLAQVTDGPIVVRCHPDDLDVVSQAATTVAGVDVTGDDTLAPGDARISGPWVTVELTREQRWRAVEQALATDTDPAEAG